MTSAVAGCKRCSTRPDEIEAPSSTTSTTTRREKGKKKESSCSGNHIHIYMDRRIGSDLCVTGSKSSSNEEQEMGMQSVCFAIHREDRQSLLFSLCSPELRRSATTGSHTYTLAHAFWFEAFPFVLAALFPTPAATCFPVSSSSSLILSCTAVL